MARVRVWRLPEQGIEHFADPPARDQVARTWAGTTLCGQQGELRWVHWEIVDEAKTCTACAAVEGSYKPTLEGDYPGPP